MHILYQKNRSWQSSRHLKKVNEFNDKKEVNEKDISNIEAQSISHHNFGESFKNSYQGTDQLGK
ncbi:MAG: hypothetical protein ABH805_01295 [Candidatus Nealsonbacteria bacterium]